MSTGLLAIRPCRFLVAVILVTVVLIAVIPSWMNLKNVAIHNAAEKGDLVKVEAMIKDDPELISYKDDYGDTPLHLAAATGHTDVAAFLLANKADANVRAGVRVRYGMMPLHLAVLNDHKDMVGAICRISSDSRMAVYQGTSF